MIKILVPVAAAVVAALAITATVSIRPNIEGFERINVVQPDESIDVIGYRTIFTMEKLIDTILTKPGGYISNDKLPPFVFLDDMPNFEYGALSVIRENAVVIRRHYTRSVGAQSLEDKDAVLGMTEINTSHDNWILPSAEGWFFSKGKFEIARDAYGSLARRLTDSDSDDGNFFARATSFSDALDSYNRILGSLSQRLSASVGGINLPGTTNDASASEAKPTGEVTSYATPWLEIDDVFWEAMGAVWALEEIFDALEYDFATVLKDKNAQLTVRQIREELKQAQALVLSPYVQNNTNVYGISANHSIALANFISRASATMIDLKKLIDNG